MHARAGAHTHTHTHTGKSTCVIITEAKPEWFAGHEHERKGRRSEPYPTRKNRLGEAMLETMHRHFPRTRGKVEYKVAASPLTNVHYLGRAASYGLTHGPARFSSAFAELVRPRTDVAGLYIAGQDVCTNGFVGALFGGVLTTHAVLGYDAVDVMVMNRNVITDLLELRRREKRAEGKKQK